MSSPDSHRPQRRARARGVHLIPGKPNWVFLTVCTDNRERWLAQPSVQRTLHKIWEQKARAWLVSDYVLMPDPSAPVLHLFCTCSAHPGSGFVEIERWISFWKDRFSKTHADAGTFQRGGMHHRLRDSESYREKWQYMRQNPVRKQLVQRAEDWPYFGCVHRICWSGE